MNITEDLNDADKRELLRIARAVVTARLKNTDLAETKCSDSLQRSSGAFVTINKKGRLRGCIGNFLSSGPLFKTVAEMAISAAFKDPRFAPLQESELDEIDFEISVLSPLREIDDISEIEVGRHGIFITKGNYRGVLLPQVATEQGWDRETFLAQTCMKAGLPSDQWRHGAKIEIFSAQVFGEKTTT